MDNIQTDLTERSCKGVDEVHLVQHRHKWWALLKMVITFPISWNTGNLLATSDTVTSAGLSFMQSDIIIIYLFIYLFISWLIGWLVGWLVS